MARVLSTRPRLTMLRSYMKRWLITVVLGVLALPVTARAVSLSGIVLYAADDFGNPNGVKTILNNELDAQLWLTAPNGNWYVLGVWTGLPPDALRVAPLNNPRDFSVEYPLTEGENDFTLLGQPGPLTRGDDYLRYAVNLYFDGNLDQPGISVLFPRNSPPDGSPPSVNKANPGNIYSLSLQSLNIDPQTLTAYDDGVDRVTVSAASFLPPETFGVDFDLVSPHQLAPSPVGSDNAADYIGVLKIMVEADATGDSGPARGPGPGGFGLLPAAPISQAAHGPDIPIGGAAANTGQMPQLPTRRDRDAPVDAVAAPAAAAADADAGEQPTPQETLTPGLAPTAAQSTTAASRTGTPDADAKGTPAPEMQGSPTPAVTGAAVTPTPQQTGGARQRATGGAARTPTPVAGKHPQKKS